MFILAISSGEGFCQNRWERILRSGIDALMIREKQLEARALLDLVHRVRDLLPGLELWVNGRLDVAMAAGCGLHMPEAYPEVPLGLLSLSRPIHDVSQMPSRVGAQQWILSPIFDVLGKGTAWGPERLHGALDAMPVFEGRVLALGGINANNVSSLRHPKLHGVAMIRALWESTDPAALVENLRNKWN